MRTQIRTILFTLIAVAATHHAHAASFQGPGSTGQGGLGGWDKTFNLLIPDLPASKTANCGSYGNGYVSAKSDVARTWGGGFAVESGSLNCDIRLGHYAKATHGEVWVFTPPTPMPGVVPPKPFASASGSANGSASARASSYTFGESAALAGGYGYINCGIMPTIDCRLVAVITSGGGTLNRVSMPGPGGWPFVLTAPYGNIANWGTAGVSSHVDSYCSESSNGEVQISMVAAYTETALAVEVFADGGSSDSTYSMTTALNVTLGFH